MNQTEQFLILDESYLPQMAALYQAAFSGAPWHDDWSDETQLLEYVREISGSYHALNYGLLLDGKLAALSIGMIRHWWEGTNYNIEEFCVAPDLQGQQLGTRFMQMIAEDVKQRGLRGIFLQTDRDKPAFRFYRKNGFEVLEAHMSLYRRLEEP